MNSPALWQAVKGVGWTNPEILLCSTGPIAGHVGDGNFHCLMVLDPNDPDEVLRVHQFTERLAR